MRTKVLRITVLAAAVQLAGCATYLEAKNDTAPGGRIDQERNAAQAQLDAARIRNVQLANDKMQRDREIERSNQRVATLEQDLRGQEQLLSDALSAKRISQQRHTQLRTEVASIRKEIQRLDQQAKANAQASDPQALAAKEQQLRDLEARKKQLQLALAQIASGK